MGDEEEVTFSLCGFLLSRDSKGTLNQHQNIYLKKLEKILIEAHFTAFRSMQMELAWLANTISEGIFQTYQLEQVTESRFEVDKHDTLKS